MNDHKRIPLRNKEESNLCSGLYIVPTPIGNLRDMTLRGLEILTHCDVIVCEDSRVTGQLLKAYSITDKKKIVYNDHADDALKNKIIALAHDNIIALVSDAGTPMISDPGYKLVRECIKENIYVTALPGANAVLPALQLSGMATDSFTFAGFLPSKDKGVRNVIHEYAGLTNPVIFYESPKRIEKTLIILAEMMPERPIAVAREISKLYEETLRGTAGDIIQKIQQKPLKGEIALILDGCQESDKTFDIDGLIKQALNNGQSVKDLSADIANQTKMKKKEIYDRALQIQNAHIL